MLLLGTMTTERMACPVPCAVSADRSCLGRQAAELHANDRLHASSATGVSRFLSWTTCRRRLPPGAQCCGRQASCTRRMHARSSCTHSPCLTSGRIGCPSSRPCPPFSGDPVSHTLRGSIRGSGLDIQSRRQSSRTSPGCSQYYQEGC